MPNQTTPDDDPAAEWAAPDPTVSDSTHDTAPHDLTALARATASPDSHDDVLRLAYGEGQEDAIRALYAVLRSARQALTSSEQDAIVLAVRQRLTRL